MIPVVAALARAKELVLVIAEPPGGDDHRATIEFVAQLRAALPPFTIGEVAAGGGTTCETDDYATVADLLNDGALVVVVTDTIDAPNLAASLADRFGAVKLLLTADNAEKIANGVLHHNSHQHRSNSG
ncbi:hypothetical protein Drose_16630 [Dactylosporangium roseum]|uniref:Uncharacterized protein n=1 Tax=Dactylosporangium roseum TaxID=47989 RepID=A0ABY5ZC73_9ACTN|nr:hypothetical protein [Dactylosporangium roseum]UWZ39695.1 hypothetical protein Drose_16630 [Dactylosporangium roseum]